MASRGRPRKDANVVTLAPDAPDISIGSPKPLTAEEQNWLAGFVAFAPHRTPMARGRQTTVSISPKSGKLSVSADLGKSLTFDSEDGKGWVTLWRDPTSYRVAIVAERDQGTNTIRITRTKGQRYVINAKAFLITHHLMPEERITLEAQWMSSEPTGVVFMVQV